jgi:hypothetical protein
MQAGDGASSGTLAFRPKVTGDYYLELALDVDSGGDFSLDYTIGLR